jgi:hypothetical protein
MELLEISDFFIVHLLSFSSFVEKLTEFLRLFVALHLHRLEESHKFSPVREFLNLLFKYTFHTALEQFYRCLEVWSIFLDHMHNRGTPTERLIHLKVVYNC